jgi:hypothetical protein
MGQVYKTNFQVVVWLSERSENSDCAIEAMNLIPGDISLHWYNKDGEEYESIESLLQKVTQGDLLQDFWK